MFICHKCETEWVSEKKRSGFKEFCETTPMPLSQGRHR